MNRTVLPAFLLAAALATALAGCGSPGDTAAKPAAAKAATVTVTATPTPTVSAPPINALGQAACGAFGERFVPDSRPAGNELVVEEGFCDTTPVYVFTFHSDQDAQRWATAAKIAGKDVDTGPSWAVAGTDQTTVDVAYHAMTS